MHWTGLLHPKEFLHKGMLIGIWRRKSWRSIMLPFQVGCGTLPPYQSVTLHSGQLDILAETVMVPFIRVPFCNHVMQLTASSSACAQYSSLVCIDHWTKMNALEFHSLGPSFCCTTGNHHSCWEPKSTSLTSEKTLRLLTGLLDVGMQGQHLLPKSMHEELTLWEQQTSAKLSSMVFLRRSVSFCLHVHMVVACWGMMHL